MTIDRRTLLQGATTSIAFAALAAGGPARASSRNPGLPLLPDPARLLDLPNGFAYRLLTSTGQPMSDGFLRPGRPDGMACFADPRSRGRLILVRNHENWPDTKDGSPFGADGALAARLPADRRFDPAFIGGTTTMIVDRRTGAFQRDYLSLAGTAGNCSGGATPWGSWLSCEESAVRTGEEGATRDHGFVFEVPIAASGPVVPRPLTAMGRFTHEAAEVEPATGIVYMTEDDGEGLFTRFLPNRPGRLADGGTLQALAIADWASADTRNWPLDWSKPSARDIAPGQRFATRWITLANVDSPDGDLRQRGHAAGAALFCRGEGLARGTDPDGRSSHYFTCTEGGRARTGQVWRYQPGRGEGTPAETAGTLTLQYESPGADTLDLCDNLTVTPWGDLLLCEDGEGSNYLRLLAPDGTIRDLARNAHAGNSEFCGACFSPDGRFLFVNIQKPGFTLAVSGPWQTLRAA